MKTTNFADRNTSAGLRVLYCLALAFCFAFAGCALQIFSRLEEEALEYGTVSVGAVRVTDYNNRHLEDARGRLKTALENLRKELEGDPNSHRALSAAAEDLNQSSNAGDDSSGAIEGQAPRPSEIELVGLRMAALKFVESELEDLELDCISPNEPNFRRVVISLDCSAWVRGKAGAALVYVDLYPYKVDRWCYEAAQIMKEWWNEEEKARQKKTSLPPSRKECYQDKWEKLIDKELADKESGNAFKRLDKSTRKMPETSEIEDKRDPGDWVAFCHRWLAKKKLFPRIVHVERMGKAEYLILAEADYSTTEFGIGAQHPVGVSAKWGVKTRKEAGLLTATVRPLSLAFVAGYRRAGWLFMPSKTREGRMPPTERRLRMVVDVPEKLSKLAIHIHKVFLGPDLGVIPGAAFVKQVENLDRARQTLTEGDKLYKKYRSTEPRHYRLIKTRMRNLLYQGWAEEIVVDIPPVQN
jgi:hypothetical protein